MTTLKKSVCISLPIAGISLVGFLAFKVQKLKRQGRITSLKALLTSVPIIIQAKRYIHRKQNIEKEYYFNQLGGTIKTPNQFSQALRPPEKGEKPFLLNDHWKCRPSDVIVAVPSKSGTGWVLQICQQLRVGGEDNVNYNQDLLDVCPFIEAMISELLGRNNERAIPPDPSTMPAALDMNADHNGTDIRVFKSHLDWKSLEGTNCKKIYMYRNDVDAIYSAYRFFIEKILEAHTYITPYQFATLKIFKGAIEKNLMNLCDFWEHRNDSNVEFFFFDDMKENHSSAVKRIARLMGIETTPELIEKVVSQSTFEFMSSPERHLRFDEYVSIACIRRAVGLTYDFMPEVSGQQPRGDMRAYKIVKGDAQAIAQPLKNQNLAKYQEERFNVEECYKKTWEHVVLPRTGFGNLNEMRAAWKSERTKLTE